MDKRKHLTTEKKIWRSESITQVPEKFRTPSKHVYRMGKFIGSGTFAKCFKVIEETTQKKYACKIMWRKLMEETAHGYFVASEIEILKQMRHPNVVQFVESFVDHDYIYIIQTYCPKLSLRELKKSQDISEGEVKYLMAQIFRGIAYIHSKNVIHRDLKLANILLDDEYQVKIADFGLAIKTSNLSEVKHMCGTTKYMGPELFQDRAFSFASDIWAAGVVMYFLLYGTAPFDGDDSAEVIHRITQIDYSIPDGIDRDCLCMFSMVFARDPKARPTAKQCLELRYLVCPPKLYQLYPDKFMPGDDPSYSSFSGFNLQLDNLGSSAEPSRPTVKLPMIEPIRMPPFGNSNDFSLCVKVLQRLQERMHSICESLTSRKKYDDSVIVHNEEESRPQHWVHKWTYDCEMENGFAYKLFSGSYGMLCHDGVRMRLNENRECLVLELGDDRMKKIPANRSDLGQKQIIFDKFVARLCAKEAFLPTYVGALTPSVQFWYHTSEAIIMLFSNNVVQVNFCTSRGKYLIDPTKEAITKIQTRGQLYCSTTKFSTLASKEYLIVDIDVLKYITAAIKFLASHLNKT